MMVDEFNNDEVISMAVDYSFKINLLDTVLISIHNCRLGFVNALTEVTESLNEDKYTQIFVQQNQFYLQNYPLHVSVQYRDISGKTKGIPDIHYSFIEQGKYNEPFFLIEAKRLPTPSKTREKEYVTSKNNSGGMERFKKGIHGLNKNHCGIIGFIEKEDEKYWYTKINEWIELQSLTDCEWKRDEILTLVNPTYYSSVLHRENDDLKLHHFLIKVK